MPRKKTNQLRPKSHPDERFTVTQVLAIRQQAVQGYTRKQLAAAYRCAPLTISRLLTGQTYSNVRDVGAPPLPVEPSRPRVTKAQQAQNADLAERLTRKKANDERKATHREAEQRRLANERHMADVAETTTPTKTAPPPAAPPPPQPPAAPPRSWDFNTPQPGPPAPPDPRAPRLIRREKDENGRQVAVYRCYLAWCTFESRTESVVREHSRDEHKDLVER